MKSIFEQVSIVTETIFTTQESADHSVLLPENASGTKKGSVKLEPFQSR